jgi:ER membrane protein complex subunit 1
VAQVKKIVTSPALLESSTLVFAHGLDLFCGRAAPSGTFDVLSPNFNKAQLVLTILALATGIIAVRPMVRKKMLRERWYQ